LKGYGCVCHRLGTQSGKVMIEKAKLTISQGEGALGHEMVHLSRFAQGAKACGGQDPSLKGLFLTILLHLRAHAMLTGCAQEAPITYLPACPKPC
jgi:hypothetical protein